MSCPQISLERVLFALAGTMTLAAAVLALLVSPWFLLLGVFVGANQWLYATLGGCPASLALRRSSWFAQEVSR
ncbi:MAG TPA: hypothetical protein VFO56_05045 [Gaiellaceae bacterium]|nr:hypothetical protein [Gaiellaceae bacterium]